MLNVHRHSFSKIRNPSTIVAGKRQGCREISGIDKNHIPVSIQYIQFPSRYATFIHFLPPASLQLPALPALPDIGSAYNTESFSSRLQPLVTDLLLCSHRWGKIATRPSLGERLCASKSSSPPANGTNLPCHFLPIHGPY